MKPMPAALAMLLSIAPATAQRPAAKPVANPFSDRLAALKDVPRRAVLRRAVLDSNQWCDRVSTNLRRGTWRNLSVWNARCGRGADYAVFIGMDQSVQVRPCKDLAALKLPRCALPPR